MTIASQTFDSHASSYNAARRRLIPPLDAFYGTAVEAALLAGSAKRVLDIGAGTGLLSAAIRESGTASP